MMKNIKRTVKMILALALAFMLTLAMFGCGSNDTVDDGTLPEGYVPDPAGRVKLQYYIASSESDKRSVNDWVAAFKKKYPNVTVETELSQRGKSAIQAEIAAKSVGDVFFLWEVDVYNYAVTQNCLMPLDSYVEAYDIDISNVFSAIYNMGVVQGKLYMVMRDYNHIVLMYNKDMIQTANLTDPVELEQSGEWTWDTFKEYCEKLTTQDENADTQTCGCQLRLNYDPVYCPILEGWGGSWYDTENKKVSFVSDANVLEACNEIVEFLQSNVCKMSCVDDDYGVSIRSINATQSQKNFDGYSTTTDICFQDTEFPSFAGLGKTYDNAGVSWDVVSMPAYPTHKVGTGSTGFAVFNGSKNTEAAAALCLSLYTEEGQRAYNGQEGGSVPNVKTLADSDFWRVPYADSADESLTEDELADAKNYYAFVSFPEADTYGRVRCVVPPDIADIVVKYMANVFQDAVNGTKSVEDTLTTLETEANEKWSVIYTG